MSRGIGGSARMVTQDTTRIIYEYAPYNLNDEKYRNASQIYDGKILIDRAALVEPEIHEKIKKWPSGRKQRLINIFLVRSIFAPVLKAT